MTLVWKVAASDILIDYAGNPEQFSSEIGSEVRSLSLCCNFLEEDQRMAAANPGKVQPWLMDRCVNCKVFNWGQPEELTTLRKCKQCKVVQYCSESCQKEHWMMVHKQQCKKIASVIAFYQEIGDDSGVYNVISSHHPFPALELPGNPSVALVMLALKVLSKMQFRNQSVYAKVSSQLAELEVEMTRWMERTWAYKKIFPEKCRLVDLSKISNLCKQTSGRMVDEELASQDLWSTLHLVLGRLYVSEAVDMVDILKDPRGVVPAKLWVGLEQEVGPFPNLVADLIKALSGDQFPSFQELLKIFCGGSLSQACSFCSTRMDVAAVSGEVLGRYVGIPAVSIIPFLPPMFKCGAETCKVELLRKKDAFVKLYFGLGATLVKLRSTTCDYCFLRAEKAHRYNDETGSNLFDICVFSEVQGVSHQDVLQRGMQCEG